MKRLRIMVGVLTVAVLLVGLVSCAKPLTEIEEPHGEVLLPNFQIERTDADGLITYKDVSVEDYDKYLESLEQEGFTNAGRYWYREDECIMLQRGQGESASVQVRSMKAQITLAEGAYSQKQIMKRMEDSLVVFMMEQSPDGFYEKTGAQVFFALGYVKDNSSQEATYTERYYLVSEKSEVLIEDCMVPVCADMDDDGIHEIVWIGNGFTSGRFTFSLCVYHVQDGMIQEKAFAYYESDAYRMSLRADGNGQVWLDYRKSTDEQTNSTKVTIEDNIVRIDDGEHFEFLHANKFQR